MTVIDYITEEVTRQGHDVDALDGIERVGWMLNAWAYALERSDRLPNKSDVMNLGKIIEPFKNWDRPRTCRVRVGMNACPEPADLPRLLDQLFEARDRLTAIEFYKEFELIHPFQDGNGRVGKILYNSLNGTLLKPIFPPADLFGHPIRNP